MTIIVGEIVDKNQHERETEKYEGCGHKNMAVLTTVHVVQDARQLSQQDSSMLKKGKKHKISGEVQPGEYSRAGQRIEEQRKEASVMNPARLRPCYGGRAKSGAEKKEETSYNKRITKREIGTEQYQMCNKRNLDTAVF